MAGNHGVSDQELDGLSAEERAAIEADQDDDDQDAGGDDEGDDGEAAAPAKAADEGADKGDADDKGAKAGDDAGADKGEKAADAGAADDAGGDKPAAAEDEDEEPIFAPTYHAEPVEGYKEKMAALEEREAKAEKDFKDGEIEFDAYKAEMARVRAERDDLRDKKLKADIAEEQSLQAAEQTWAQEIQRFYRRVQRTEHLDYQANRHLNAALDAEVKALANDPANKDKESVWFLNEAHKNVKKALGLDELRARAAGGADKGADKAAAADKGKPAAAKPAAKPAAAPARRPDRKAIPPDLGGVPQSEGAPEDVGGSEFSDLDQLSGIELENALAKLPKEKVDRYLRGE